VNRADDAGSHPRPQQRREWISLDGPWEFAFGDGVGWRAPADVRWDRRICVPFAPESPASEIGDPGFHTTCWYRKVIELPAGAPDDVWLLHFNAVDYTACVWANGRIVAEHEGAYTRFTAELTGLADAGGRVEIVVRADDDPQDLAKPRGKQDWQLEPHSIWYPRTSGIWQTVWLERVPRTRIDDLRWYGNLERWEIRLEMQLGGERRDDLRFHVQLRTGANVLADDTYHVIAGEVNRSIGLSDPGIDDYRNTLLWSPHSPTLIEATLELLDADDNVVDRVLSYTALRSVGVQGQSVVLNGRPFPLRMVLDQGYWPATGLTPPDTDALRRDVELAKEMGFNGVRKHQKIEDERYLYWADRLGLLVWVEMPSAYRFTTQSVQRLTRQWAELVPRLSSHPSIIAWVPFNESWGVPNLPDIRAQREWVQALYHLTHTMDPTRPVIGNDGWESAATDIVGIHDYDHLPQRLAQRYRTHDDIPELFQRERPGGRMLTLEGHPHAGQPIVLSEFGGIACDVHRPGAWGYSVAPTCNDFAERYAALLEVVRGLPALAGFCYTQFADTYQEANGLLYSDRTPKFPLELIADATRGPRVPRIPLPDSETTKLADRGAPGVQHEPNAP